ncbi:hypothetical protein OAM67_01320 [bacterium]|nr:hypothetical protein [bacterium]
MTTQLTYVPNNIVRVLIHGYQHRVPKQDKTPFSDFLFAVPFLMRILKTITAEAKSAASHMQQKGASIMPFPMQDLFELLAEIAVSNKAGELTVDQLELYVYDQFRGSLLRAIRLQAWQQQNPYTGFRVAAPPHAHTITQSLEDEGKQDYDLLSLNNMRTVSKVKTTQLQQNKFASGFTI